MARPSLKRLVRSRFRAAVVWAMMPLAILNGRFVLGCLSPSGQYNPDCRCWAASNSKHAATAPVCRCSCCDEQKQCCCNSKAKSCEAKHGDSHPQNGVSDGKRHCTPVAMYLTVPGVIASIMPLANHITPAILDAVTPPLTSALADIGQLIEWKTGPPPDNLVITLHRLLI